MSLARSVYGAGIGNGAYSNYYDYYYEHEIYHR